MPYSNISMLGSVLSQHMQRVQRAGDTKSIELGVINADMSLSVDSLNGTIPSGEYLIPQRLKSSGELASGDRVVVAWAGADPIVLDKVTS